MKEDLELNRCLKDKLEAHGSFRLRPETLALSAQGPAPARGVLAPLGRVRVWPALLAASLTLVLALGVWLRPAAHDPLSEAIAFLAEADGVELTAGESPADLLMAWQEAPCQEWL